MDQHHRPLLNGWRQSNTGRRTWRRGALPLSAARREVVADTPAPRQQGWTVTQYRALAKSTKAPHGRGYTIRKDNFSSILTIAPSELARRKSLAREQTMPNRKDPEKGQHRRNVKRRESR